MIIAGGCKFERAIPKDRLLTSANVELAPDRLCDRLWREQTYRFFPEYSHTTQGNKSP